MRPYIFILRLVFITFFFSHFSASFAVSAPSEEAMYNEARKAYYSLKDSPEKRKLRHNWLNVINKFEKVHKAYPGREKGDAALYMAATLFVELHPYSGQKSDLRSSNKLIEKLVKAYPSSSLADDALFMMGENYEKLSDKEKAYSSYLTLAEKHSNGDMIQKARLKLSALSAYAPRENKPAKAPEFKKAFPRVSRLAQPGNLPAEEPDIKGSGHTVYVTGVRHWSNPNYTRIVVDLEGKGKYKDHLLRQDPSIGKPPRLYIDFFGANKKATLTDEIPIDDGLLKRVRLGQYDKDTVRVVLDIESIRDYKIFPMFDPFRVVIDVMGEDKLKAPSIEALLKGDEKVIKSLKESDDDEKLSLSRQLGLGVRKIVIDAGHGGKDPGAVGPRGTKEKDVTLRLAKRLKEKLEKDFAYQVVLTRDSDRYLQLDERTAIANVENADLFVSIHANANRNRKRYGMETYVMNARASNRYASEVAARENAVTMKNMGEFGSELGKIFADMNKTNKVNESNKLASSIQGSMSRYMSKRYNRIKDLGVKKAPFYVLIGANMPSILVEVGFISNWEEEKRLLTEKYLDNISNSIALGLDKYANVIKTASSR
ncbi:MAG: N-acetylmuramoyl-L-alanine amidase [bacterium]|nr:N-acetylmuramoyl-L-alanine amidase [bacterium]